MRVGIGLGSNLGARAEELAAARVWLRGLDAGVIFSGIYETEAVDCPPGSPGFCNQVAEMGWSGSLFSLLDLLQAYERGRGRRTVRGRNQPRPMDLDLLYADEVQMRTVRLALPHPRMGGRSFVMEPLAEICPSGGFRGCLERWGRWRVG